MSLRNVVAIRVKKLSGMVNPREETPVGYDFPGPDLRGGMLFDRIKFGEVFVTKVNRRVLGGIEESVKLQESFLVKSLRIRIGTLREKVPVIAETILGIVRKIHYTSLGEYLYVPLELIEGFLKSLIDEYTPPVQEVFDFSFTRSSDLNDPHTFQESFTSVIVPRTSLMESLWFSDSLTGERVEASGEPAIIVSVGASSIPDPATTEAVGGTSS